MKVASIPFLHQNSTFKFSVLYKLLKDWTVFTLYREFEFSEENIVLKVALLKKKKVFHLSPFFNDIVSKKIYPSLNQNIAKKKECVKFFRN